MASPAGIARVEREKAERRRLKLQVVELRQTGHSFRQIAEIQGCSVRTATNRYRSGIKNYIPQELIEAARATELDRYDALTQIAISMMARAYEKGDVDAVCKLQDRVLSISAARSKILPIQVPTHVVIDQSVTAQTTEDKELADLLARATQDVEEKLKWITDEVRAESR